MKKRFSDEQIVGFLREAEAGNKTIEQLAREHGFSQNSFYVWKRKYGCDGRAGREAAARVGEGERRLKRLLAERDVEIDVMKEFIEKKLPM